MTLVLAGRTDAVLAAAAAAADADGRARVLLTATELQRAAGLRDPDDRADFLAAHALVRLCAGRLLGRPAHSLTVVQSCAECGGTHGRPRLAEAPGTCVSLSHTRGWVAASASRRTAGVDIEAVATPPDWRTAELACGAGELAELRAHPRPATAFVRQWVRKEALIKAGVLTLDELARCDLPVAPAGLLRWRGWLLTDWAAPAGAAVGCVASREAARLEFVT